MVRERSDLGCWTCRIRRKKCDENRQACDVCRLLQIHCYGYGQKPSWMDGGREEKLEIERIKRTVKKNRQHRRRYNDTTTVTDRNLAGERRTTTNDRPSTGSGPKNYNLDNPIASSGLIPIVKPSSTSIQRKGEEPSKSCAADGFHGHAEKCAQILCLQCGLSTISDSRNESEANLLMHYLDVVFPLLFRFYNPLVSEGGRGWLLMILLRTKPLFHAALSLSAQHAQKLTTATEADEGHDPLSELTRHHILALTELRGHIDCLKLPEGNMTTKTQVEILACIIHLISFEVFRGGNTEWQTHLQAARLLFYEVRDAFSAGPAPEPVSSTPIIELLSPASSSATQSTYLSSNETKSLDFFVSAFVWFDILSCVTTNQTPSYPEIFSSLLYIDDGRIQLCKLMGCKNWVMLLIMEIAILDDWKKTRQKSGNLSLRELTSKAAHIEDRLTAGMNKTLDEPISIYKDSCGIRTSESRCVTYIFACSALTYLHVTVSGAYPDLPEIRESIARSIKAFQNLPDPIWVRHLVWPFCIAGCMAAANEQDVFREIANGAYLDGQIFGNFEKALKIMERCWQGRQEQENGCTPWDWKRSMNSLGQMVFLI